MKYIITTIILILFWFCQTDAKPIVAFGYLANKSGNVNLNYMEVIFPNSFASALQAEYNCDVIKPVKLQEMLEKKQLSLQKHYEPHELPYIAEKIGCDMFIFGHFLTLPDNNIQIVLTLFDQKTSRIFSFTNIGKLETEIIKIIDRVTLVLFDFMSKNGFFLFEPIVSGSTVGLISNCTQEEMNVIYVEFINAGYSLLSIQANELDAYYSSDVKIMNSFYNITTVANTYDIITDWTKYKYYVGVWDYEKQKQWDSVFALYQQYERNYLTLKNRVFEKFIRTYPKCEYVMVIVFNDARTKCWARAINIKEKKLVFMQQEISAKGLIKNLQTTTRALISIIQQPTALPQKSKKSR